MNVFKHIESDENILAMLAKLGFIMTCLAALMAGSFGWSQGENIIGSIGLSGGLVIASFIVGYLLVVANMAFDRGKTVVGIVSIALFVTAVSVELMSHIGFTGANRSALIQEASFQDERHTETKGAVGEMKAKLASQRRQLVAMEGIVSPDAYATQMADMQKTGRWKATSQCTDATVPKSIAFCKDYANSARDLEIAKNKALLLVAAAETESALSNARSTAAVTTKGHSAAQSQALVLASFVSLSDKPTEVQTYWTNLGMSAVMAVFFVMAGGLNFVAHAFREKVEAAPQINLPEVLGGHVANMMAGGKVRMAPGNAPAKQQWSETFKIMAEPNAT